MRQSRQVCSATLSCCPADVQPLRVTVFNRSADRKNASTPSSSSALIFVPKSLPGLQRQPAEPQVKIASELRARAALSFVRDRLSTVFLDRRPPPLGLQPSRLSRPARLS